MTKPHTRLRLRASVLAVHGALATLAPALAQPTDPAWKAQTQPENQFSFGVTAANRASAKANEFNGITGKDPLPLVQFDLNGGGAYDSTSARRWSLRGLQLGTQSPAVEADYSIQGAWRLRLGVDSLLRQASDSFQSPYLNIGSADLRLPSNWVVPVVPRVSATAPNARGLSPEVTASGNLVAGVLTPPTAAQATAAAALQAADLPAFRNVDLGTRRTRYGFAWEQQLGTHWSWSAEVSQEHKSGMRAQGAQSRATNGDTASILPVPVDQDDNKLALTLAYASPGANLQLAYEDSLFTNRVAGVSWNLWAAPGITATMAMAPSNRSSKLSASGNLKLGDATQLSGSAWYTRGTQNEPFLPDTTAPWVPVPSANALVVSEGLSLKALHRLTSTVQLAATAKLDEHDNRTPVNIYGYYDNNNAVAGVSPFAALFPTLSGLGQNFNINANTPYSRRTRTLAVDADWRAAPGQLFKARLEDQAISRWCNNTWISCANASESNETSLRLDWRGQVNDDIQARLGVANQQRRLDYNENSFLAGVPMANRSPSTATGALAGSTFYSAMVALGLTGHGPLAGLPTATAPVSALQAFYFPLNNAGDNLLYGNENRISEPVGLRRFNQADRQRNKLRTGVDWQASERLQLQAGLDVNDDRYTDATYGLQRMGGWTLNLDSSFAVNDDTNIGLFATRERQRARFAGITYSANSTATAVAGATAIDGGCLATIAARNASNKIDSCLDWTATELDRSTTLGASLAMNRLAGGKLDLSAQAYWARNTNDISFTGGNYVNNPLAGVAGAATRTTAAFYIPAESLPTSSTSWLGLQLSAAWHLSTQATVRIGYSLQRLRSVDWAYEGQQDGGLTQVLPTREQAPQFTVHRVGVAYMVGF